VNNKPYLKTKYTTVHLEEFKHPKDAKQPEAEFDEFAYDNYAEADRQEDLRESKRHGALEKLSHIAKHKFGSLGRMMRLFGKGSGDSITLTELKENIRKRKLVTKDPMRADLLTEEDQQLVFEELDNKKQGYVAIDHFLTKVEQVELKGTVARRDMLEVRAFLEEQLQKRRVESKEDAAILEQESHMRTYSESFSLFTRLSTLVGAGWFTFVDVVNHLAIFCH
jgi:hypothetical protein